MGSLIPATNTNSTPIRSLRVLGMEPGLVSIANSLSQVWPVHPLRGGDRRGFERRLVDKNHWCAMAILSRSKGGVVPLAILDALGDGVTLADERGHIVFSNKAADRILGVAPTDSSPEEWAAHYGVFLPDGSAPFPTEQYPLMRALRGEETDGVRMLIRNAQHPAGLLIMATGRPMRDENDRIVGASVVFRKAVNEGTAFAALRAELESLRLELQSTKHDAAMVDRLDAALRHCDVLEFRVDRSSEQTPTARTFRRT